MSEKHHHHHHHHHRKDYESLHPEHHHKKKRKKKKLLPPPRSYRSWEIAAGVVAVLGVVAVVGYSISLAFPSSSSTDTSLLIKPLTASGNYWVEPNQLAGNLWYRPGPLDTLVNGFLADNYGTLSNWPNLQANLKSIGGAGLGIFSATIGFTHSDVFLALRRANISVMTEEPGFTQCLSGTEIGGFEFFGTFASVLCTNFLTCTDSLPPGRIDPAGVGWYTTSDGKLYAPDEIITDDRMPNVLDYYGNLFDLELNNPTVNCPQLGDFHPGMNLVSAGIQDYVDFAAVMKLRFPAPHTPRLSINWNANPNWELAEYGCLVFDTTANLGQTLDHACHNDSNHLMQLVRTLCDAGTCPATIYHDVDVIWSSAYALNVLARNKFLLHESGLGVGFAVSVEEQCGTGSGLVSTLVGNDIQCLAGPNGVTGNALWAQGITTLVAWYFNNHVFDGTTRMRLASWNDYPIEVGAQTAETVPFSMAATYNLILNNIVIPNLANFPDFTLVNIPMQARGYFSLVPAHQTWFSDGVSSVCFVNGSVTPNTAALYSLPAQMTVNGSCL